MSWSLWIFPNTADLTPAADLDTFTYTFTCLWIWRRKKSMIVVIVLSGSLCLCKKNAVFFVSLDIYLLLSPPPPPGIPPPTHTPFFSLSPNHCSSFFCHSLSQWVDSACWKYINGLYSVCLQAHYNHLSGQRHPRWLERCPSTRHHVTQNFCKSFSLWWDVVKSQKNVTDGQDSDVGLGGSYHIRNDSVGLCWVVEVGRFVRLAEVWRTSFS